MDRTTTTTLFAVGAVAGVGNLVGVVASALGWAEYRPPGERTWEYYAHWTLSQVVNVSVVGVAYLDWNALGPPQPAALAGGVVFVAWYGAAIAAGLDLGMEETKGLTGELRTDGWYRYSRNPQYVCYVVATVGFAVMAGRRWRPDCARFTSRGGSLCRSRRNRGSATSTARRTNATPNASRGWSGRVRSRR